MLGEQRKQEIGLPIPGTGPQQCGPGIAAGFPVVDEGLQDRGGRYETGLNAELPGQRVDICADLLPELPAFRVVALPGTRLRNAVRLRTT